MYEYSQISTQIPRCLVFLLKTIRHFRDVRRDRSFPFCVQKIAVKFKQQQQDERNSLFKNESELKNMTSVRVLAQRTWKSFKFLFVWLTFASVNLQRLPLARALEWFFSLVKPGQFRGRQTTVSMVFSPALTEKVPSSLNEGRRLTSENNFEWRPGF